MLLSLTRWDGNQVLDRGFHPLVRGTIAAPSSHVSPRSAARPAAEQTGDAASSQHPTNQRPPHHRTTPISPSASFILLSRTSWKLSFQNVPRSKHLYPPAVRGEPTQAVGGTDQFRVHDRSILTCKGKPGLSERCLL